MDTEVFDEESGGRLLDASELRSNWSLLVAFLALVAAVSVHITLETVSWEITGLTFASGEEVLLGLVSGLITWASGAWRSPVALD